MMLTSEVFIYSKLENKTQDFGEWRGVPRQALVLKGTVVLGGGVYSFYCQYGFMKCSRGKNVRNDSAFYVKI